VHAKGTLEGFKLREANCELATAGKQQVQADYKTPPVVFCVVDAMYVCHRQSREAAASPCSMCWHCMGQQKGDCSTHVAHRFGRSDTVSWTCICLGHTSEVCQLFIECQSSVTIKHHQSCLLNSLHGQPGPTSHSPHY
jgi:hypothetical protein